MAEHGVSGAADVAGWFSRTLVSPARSGFQYSIDAGANSAYSGRGFDLGDVAHWQPAATPGSTAGPQVVGNSCVYNVLAHIVRGHGRDVCEASLAAGRTAPAWALRACEATASDLTSEVHSAAKEMRRALGPPPAKMTRTEQWVRELLHDGMRPGHSTSVCLVQAVPVPFLEHIAVRAVEVRRGRVEAARTVHGAHYDGSGVCGFLLLEVGPVAERTVNHAMFCVCADDMRSDAGWAAWARRMERCAGAALAEHCADARTAVRR